jgi:Tfp pilus assembly protein PilN
MIKINLSTSNTSGDFGGLDFSKIKIKLVLIALVAIYVPDFTLFEIWTNSLAEKNAELVAKRTSLSALKQQVAENKNFDKQIKELKAQEENFHKKLIAVKEAINFKKNPSSLLLYIAKNIPPELWINELSINENTMVIKGESLDYNSIGVFVTSLKSSVFIKDSNIVSTQNAVRESDKKRIESFEVNFTIGRFDQ